MVTSTAPVVELAFDNEFPDDLGINLWTLLPFSRGRVEIESMSAWHQPKIHVNYFSTDIDKQIQVAAARLGRKLFQTYPLSSLSAGETHPGIGRSSEDWRKDWPRLPLDATDDMWMEWIWEHFSAANQPIGTCAMMRKDLGGVVDGRLRLYGAENVRIVDASIVPMQISGRLASTLYGIAEKAADFIKSDI
jgi:choline dehydrogenase-like flavoprotein